jgi:hypothetical protein
VKVYLQITDPETGARWVEIAPDSIEAYRTLAFKDWAERFIHPAMEHLADLHEDAVVHTFPPEAL